MYLETLQQISEVLQKNMWHLKHVRSDDKQRLKNLDLENIFTAHVYPKKATESVSYNVFLRSTIIHLNKYFGRKLFGVTEKHS